MGTNKATALVLGAGVLWGLISVFSKALAAGGLSSVEITAVRMFVGAAGMFLVLAVTDRSKLRIDPRHLWMFVGTGIVSVSLFNVCFFTCIQLSEVSIAVILLYTSPIWVMLMSALLFRERVTAPKLVALAMTMAGSVLVAGLAGGAVVLSPAALGAGLASGFFYALYSIFSRIALKHYESTTITFYTFLMGAVCMAFLGNPGHIAEIVSATPTVGLWGVGIGVFCTIAPFLLYTSGLQHLETSRAAILVTVEPMVGALLGIFAFHESTGAPKICGIVLILAAVVLLNLPERKKAADA